MGNSLGLYSSEHEHDACGIGFIAHMKGRKSHDIIEKALLTLHNLEHRGACGCEENTGDGAGILIQTPHDFLARVTKPLGFTLPAPGRYGTGLVFMPQDPVSQDKGAAILEKIVREQGQVFLGWRDVPYDDSMIGDTARRVMPSFRQVFIGLGPKGAKLPGEASDAFERRLFIIRKTFENEIRNSGLATADEFYIPSLSSRTLIYKGMLISHQVGAFFPDLKEADMTTALAVVHSRFSTNTFPNWKLAHPFRFISHNGEINTVRGNINWCRAREALFASPLFGDELKKVLPVICEGNSDSASFDNMLEMLVMAGYSLPHAVMMMIPEAWSGHESMPQSKKDFYEYHACLMEPWDGPASIAFTDGRVMGAVLDRNGLRPSRYYVTKDDLVIMASEVGVLDIPPDQVILKGRLQPGRMFLVNLEEGRIIDDKELKEGLCQAQPYSQWLSDELVHLSDLPKAKELPEPDHDTITKRQISFGYTQEDVRYLMMPMAFNGEEALGSMGNDTPLAVLTEKPQNLFCYFKQLFAQVTNPPLDAIREELVTSVETTIGPENNLLGPSPESAHQIKLKNPILDNEELGRLKRLADAPSHGFKARVLPMLFNSCDGEAGLKKALDELFAAADKAISEGVNIIILSDRGINDELAAIPSLLATAGLHHHLVRTGQRIRTGLVVETGEPREVHHFALLLGYGAGAINPYLAFETFDDLLREGWLTGIDHEKAVVNYTKAVKKGIVKVMSKMGISTIQSYRGAQIFEAIGLNKEVIDQYFTHTASRIGGIGLDTICQETLTRHQRAYPQRVSHPPALDVGGEYQWRRDGVAHMLNPDSVGLLQYATRHNKYNVYKQYAQGINDQSKNLCTLRGLFKFKKGNPVPIDEVESVESIFRRFKTGAMSYGSISAEAHETLAIAMNRIGGKSNTGEGGEDPRRFKPDANGDRRRSAIKQVASGRFGVTSHYLVEADEIQIKIAQGAKPGEGGQLPGHKVYPWIAKVRLSTPGVGLISPPPHHDIYSIEDLAQLIFDLKNANRKAGISVKLVSEVGVGTVAAGVAKAHADLVLISGYDGGTGASPLTSIKHAGIPWELGLAETQQTLVMNDLRGRIRVEVDGQMKTGRDVVIGALLGGEEYGFATAPLVTMGCIMMRVCHLDTCPVGVATQNPELRKKFSGKADYVVNFFRFVAQEVREIMAELGFRTMDEMIGRSDLLDFNEAIAHYKAKGLDFTTIFHRPIARPEVAVRQVSAQDHGLDKVIDNDLIAKCLPALESKKKVTLETAIKNTNRTTATMLGSELTRRYGAEGLPEDTIHIKFTGSAGQSFGAFVPKGITLSLEGDANDYVGKGLSGGKIIIYPSPKSPFKAEENILIGNVVLYGATAGEAYFRGIAGERFCVRNSGAQTVVEGLGDHGCEYMTGGRVAVIGPTGRNFGAGMSGGVAYVYNPEGDFKTRCNMSMVEIDPLDEEDRASLKAMLEKHHAYTQSPVAAKILQSFDEKVKSFVKVMPSDYKKALIQIKQRMQELGCTEKEAMYG